MDTSIRNNGEVPKGAGRLKGLAEQMSRREKWLESERENERVIKRGREQ